jgi:hypothetical protein
VSERDRGDRPKKSWRELDAQRDRAGGRASGGDRPRPASAQSERASKQHRAALDALFAKGELGKFAEKLGAPGGARAPATPASAQANANANANAPANANADAPAGGTAADDAPAPRRAAPAPSEAPKPASPADEARATLRKKILAALGREEISRAVDKYCKAHGMPADFEILEQALEHTRADRVADALDALAALLERERPKRSRTLVSKLRFIEETWGDPELARRAAAVRQKLGG